MPTSPETLEMTEARVISFDPSRKIAELEARIRTLEEENRALERKRDSYGVFIRCLAERYFSENDESRYYAGQESQNVDADVAFIHWWQHGGREAFSRDFPTPEAVMRYFQRRHRVARFLAVFAVL
ncbi:MAG: SAM-dependent DNA methyltransferase [Patescibacteria group bacterium]|nr:SAM-dependent DNA methyltransferase [Patescibacteria group bacterium]MDE2116336.1 SAM-dependent DNA methyltransferase [Patescibacteria group bacterium]